MRRLLPRAEAEAQLRSPTSHSALKRTFGRLPSDVDPTAIASGMISLLRAGRGYETPTRRATPAVVEAFVEQSRDRSKGRHWSALFLSEFMRSNHSWAEAIDAFGKIKKFEALVRHKRKPRARALTRDPHFSLRFRRRHAMNSRRHSSSERWSSCSQQTDQRRRSMPSFPWSLERRKKVAGRLRNSSAS